MKIFKGNQKLVKLKSKIEQKKFSQMPIIKIFFYIKAKNCILFIFNFHFHMKRTKKKF